MLSTEGDYEQVLVAKTLAMAMDLTRPRSPKGKQVLKWIENRENLLDLQLGPIRDSAKRALGKDVSKSDKSKAEWTAVRSTLERYITDREDTAPDLLAMNALALGQYLGLDAFECGLFQIIARTTSGGPFSYLCDTVVKSRLLDGTAFLAQIMQVSHTVIGGYLAGEHLLPSGLIRRLSPYHCYGFQYELPYQVFRAIAPPKYGITDIERSILGPKSASGLNWDDFSHLGTAGDVAAGILKGGLNTGEQGINILFYGPPGTGKTEFAKTLAGRIDVDLYAVGEEDTYGEEPDRNDRIEAYILSQKLAAKKGKALLLFDEMEDLTGWTNKLQSHWHKGSKVFANRLFESNIVPTIWIANEIDGMDPALLRRFSFAIEFRHPTAQRRREAVRRVFSEETLASSEKVIDCLAQEKETSFGILAGAAKAARLAGGDGAMAGEIAKSLVKVVRGNTQPPSPDTLASYDPSLLNADRDLDALTRQLTEGQGARDYSFCLYGPPGTGKSAFVRHLADRLGMEFLQKRASDLLSKWVGESEKNIAEAFQEAQHMQAFLVIDEADSLLADRALASKSWEVSQVNELLSWMEAHPLPFACTTNLMDRMDAASLRRFTFKVKCDYLTRKQAEQAFTLFFGLSAPKGLLSLENLTPGDFAAVARAIRHTGETEDPYAILNQLEAECALKPGLSRRIGFAG